MSQQLIRSGRPMGRVRRLVVLLATAAMLVAGMALAPSALADPPDQAPSFSLIPRDRSADISFNYFGGDANVATFEYSVNGAAFQAGNLVFVPDNFAGSGTITGLQNGVTYSIRMRARNADGTGPVSDPVSVVPGVPDAASVVSAVPQDRSIVVSIGAPANNGGFDITGYDISVQTNPSSRVWTDAQEVDVDGVPTTTRTGLTNGTTYYVAVRARNSQGAGVSSGPSAVTPGRPSAPSVNIVTAGDQSATISFSPPSYPGGFDITGYEASATIDPADRNWKFTSITDLGTDDVFGGSTVTIDGLSNGVTYNVYIRAVNSNGPGAQSGDGQTVTPDAPPAPPTNVVATTTPSNAPSLLGTGQATITFTPPVGGGGQNPTDTTSYTVTSSPEGGVSDGCPSLDSCLITGLNNGTKYTFTVTASNSYTNNTGIASDPAESNAIVPQGAPYPPRTLLRAGAGPNSATVSFLPPYFSGRGVTSYQVSNDNGKTWRGASVRASGARRLVTATGLRSGVRYTIRVRAVNALGTGAYSAGIVSLTGPSIVSGRPTARAGTSAALVRWTASRERDVFGYYVVSSRGARCYTYTRTETSCVIGNTAGVNTSYRVYARSASGSSYASAASNSVRSSSPSVPSRVPGVPNGFAYRSSKVKSGKTATLTARGFLPSSSVVLVAYGAKRHIVKRFVTTASGSFIAKVTMPKDTAKSLTFVALGSTPFGSSKAIGTSIRRG